MSETALLQAELNTINKYARIKEVFSAIHA